MSGKIGNAARLTHARQNPPLSFVALTSGRQTRELEFGAPISLTVCPIGEHLNANDWPLAIRKYQSFSSRPFVRYHCGRERVGTPAS